jgi:hypothetical protein
MNNPRGLFFALIAASIAVTGCSSNDFGPAGPSASPQSTVYQYTAYDANGTSVATGTLTLAFEGTAVAGQQDIKGHAPEVGKGPISGQELADGSIQIELNPGGAAVVILQGKFDGNGLKGRRLLDTGDPPLNKDIGTFTISPSSVGTR